jgi:hypothetical protein
VLDEGRRDDESRLRLRLPVERRAEGAGRLVRPDSGEGLRGAAATVRALVLEETNEIGNSGCRRVAAELEDALQGLEPLGASRHEVLEQRGPGLAAAEVAEGPDGRESHRRLLGPEEGDHVADLLEPAGGR